MEQIVNLHIEKLPEGIYLATSDDVPGLVAQGRTLAETLEIARDVARRLKRLGFEFDRHAAGSHEIWFNNATNRYTTIPNHAGDLPEGTLQAIPKPAGIEPETFLQMK